MLEAQCIAEDSINRFSPAASESGVDLDCALVGWHATWMTGSWRGGSKKEAMKSSGRSLHQLRRCHAFFFFSNSILHPLAMSWSINVHTWSCTLHWLQKGPFSWHAVWCHFQWLPLAYFLRLLWPCTLHCAHLNNAGNVHVVQNVLLFFFVFFQPFQVWLTPISRLVACFHLWTKTAYRHQTIYTVLLWDSKHLISLKE